MLELLVTIAVASVVIALIMGSYVTINRGFLSKISKTQDISSAILMQKKIESFFINVQKVIVVTENEVRFINDSNDSGSSIFYKASENKLFCNNIEVAKGLTTFSMTITQTQGINGRNVLLWNAKTDKKIFIAGAKSVLVE